MFLKAAYQRCTTRSYHNALTGVSKFKRSAVAAMLKTVHTMEPHKTPDAKATETIEGLGRMRPKEAIKVVCDGFAETLTYMGVPAFAGDDLIDNVDPAVVLHKPLNEFPHSSVTTALRRYEVCEGNDLGHGI